MAGNESMQGSAPIRLEVISIIPDRAIAAAAPTPPARPREGLSRRLPWSIVLLVGLLMMPVQARGASGSGEAHAVTGWMGLAAGPTLSLSDEPNLLRLSMQMGGGLRLSGAPLELSGGLMLALCGGPSQGRRYDLGTGVPPFSVTTESRHLEAVPFVRGAYLMGDSFSAYIGLGVGAANIRTRVGLDGEFTPSTDARDSDDSEVPTFPEGGTDTMLSMQLTGGFEFTMQGAFRVFLEPLGLHTYHSKNGTMLRFSVMAGFASVF